MQLVEKVKNVFSRLGLYKKIIVPGLALSTGVTASIGLADNYENPSPSDVVTAEDSTNQELESINELDNNLDQTKQQLRQIDEISQDSNETDYSLMGC